MACDPGATARPQEPPPDVEAMEQPRRPLLGDGDGAVAMLMLRRQAPTGDGEHCAAAIAAGTLSFSKEALGRLSICNGLLLDLDLDLDQEEMPLHLTGPVEQIQIQGGQGITASLLQTQQEPLLYYMAADCNLGDGRPLLLLPVNTRVQDKWPLGTSVDDLLSYLQVRDMNTTDHMLLRGDADVNQVNATGSIGLYWFLIGTSSTMEPRTVWLLPKNEARIFQGNAHGPIHIAAFQDMLFNKYSASMIPWGSSSLQKNQLMNKEGGDWVPDDELDGFNRWVPVKGPLGTSVDDFLSYLQGPMADKTRGIGEVNYRDAMQGFFVMRLLLVDGKTSPPSSVVVEGLSTMRSICNIVMGEALSTQDASSRDPSERREAMPCWIQLVTRFEVEHKLNWRSLPPLLNAARVRDINTTEMLLRRNADVNEANAIGNIVHYWFLIGTSSTKDKEPRTGWLLLKNDARIFQGDTHGPIHMAASQIMCFSINFASTIPRGRSSTQKNQAMDKESVDWLVDHELGDFKRCYIAPHAWYTARKALVNGLNRGNQMKTQGTRFIQYERENEVVNAKDHMVRKMVDVEDTVLRASLPAELHRAILHSMLDGELSEEHNLHKRCLLPVLYLPSWFFIFRKWLLGFPVVAAKQLRERYLLSSPRGDAPTPTTYMPNLSHGVYGKHKPRDSIQFLLGVCRMYMVPGRNDPAGNKVYLPLLSQPKSELEELNSDYQYSISPLTANITGDSNDIESRQLDPCSESNNDEKHQGNECKLCNVDSHQDGDSNKNDRSVIPIFVRHVSGELVLTVSLDQSLQHLMHLYEQKTKMKLECQYFVYGRKTLEPHHTFLFYGVERDTTVHVCTRLHGGVVTIDEYVIRNKEKFLLEVTLPDGRVSLEMTKEGCLFLSTWLKCFTSAFADSKSWDGQFTWKDFKVTHGHVRVITRPRGLLTSSSMGADLHKLVQYIRKVFYKEKHNLISNFPPYLEHLITFLGTMKYPVLTPPNRLFIETHICCVESTARGILLVRLRRKYKSLEKLQRADWDKAMQRKDEQKGYASSNNLSSKVVFRDIIAQARNAKKPYKDTESSTFRLKRDTFMHAPSHRFDKTATTCIEKFKNDDGIELMIPAHNPDLVPDIILSLIEYDIESELLSVQVRCTCPLCHPSHSGSKDGGESSTSGKGKQPAQAASTPGVSQPASPAPSPGVSQPASPAQAAPNAWFPQTSSPASRILFSGTTKSASPTLQSSSSSQGTKGKGKQRK